MVWHVIVSVPPRRDGRCPWTGGHHADPRNLAPLEDDIRGLVEQCVTVYTVRTELNVANFYAYSLEHSFNR